jgi:hypothetical protein
MTRSNHTLFFHPFATALDLAGLAPHRNFDSPDLGLNLAEICAREPGFSFQACKQSAAIAVGEIVARPLR